MRRPLQQSPSTAGAVCGPGRPQSAVRNILIALLKKFPVPTLCVRISQSTSLCAAAMALAIQPRFDFSI